MFEFAGENHGQADPKLRFGDLENMASEYMRNIFIQNMRNIQIFCYFRHELSKSLSDLRWYRISLYGQKMCRPFFGALFTPF